MNCNTCGVWIDTEFDDNYNRIKTIPEITGCCEKCSFVSVANGLDESGALVGELNLYDKQLTTESIMLLLMVGMVTKIKSLEEQVRLLKGPPITAEVPNVWI